jgi:opacity protein-like surface antigen
MVIMKKSLLILLATVAGAARLASGQSADLHFVGGQSLLSNTSLGSSIPLGSKDDYKLDDGFRFGFRFAFNSASRYGQELQYGYSRTHLLLNGVDQGGMGIHLGGYNGLVYATKDGARFRPFATGGVHFANFVPPGSSASSGQGSTKFGLNYGAGLKVKLSSMWSMRLDYRQYITPKPFNLYNTEGWLRQTEISAGFGIHF